MKINSAFRSVLLGAALGWLLLVVPLVASAGGIDPLVPGQVLQILDRLGITTGGVYGGGNVVDTLAATLGSGSDGNDVDQTNLGSLTQHSGEVILAGDGAVGAPAYAFAGDADTGVWSESANRIGISAGGALMIDVNQGTNLTSITGSVSVTGDFGGSGCVIGGGDNVYLGSISDVVSISGTSATVVIPASKTVTDASATAVFTFTLSYGAMGGVRIDACTTATDGTNYQSSVQTGYVAAVNKAGTLTVDTPQFPAAGLGNSNANSSGTLTATWTTTTSGNVVTVKLTADSSLAGTTDVVRYTVTAFGAATVTPQ